MLVAQGWKKRGFNSCYNAGLNVQLILIHFGDANKETWNSRQRTNFELHGERRLNLVLNFKPYIL